jgi:mono/diheme cytochrome c family protein
MRRRSFLLVYFSLIFAASTADAADASAGANAFNTNCSFCHQIAGQGLAGQFPRIAGRANIIAGTPNGRKYLVSLVLYGMSGPITVDGSQIAGVMPSFAALSDNSIASILNYIVRFSQKPNAAPFTDAEIKPQRHDPPLSSSAVFGLRSELKASEAIPH